MSAIAGCFTVKVLDPEVPEWLGQCARLLRHRGQGLERRFMSQRAGLLELPAGGDAEPRSSGQLLMNELGNLKLAFDGRIYNHKELRARLERLGHAFVTGGEAEVVVHGYEQWGADVLSQINGVWAMAVFDETAGELFCARDRLGVRPFYCSTSSGVFLFASEIAPLLAWPGAQREPNWQRVCDFLTHGPDFYEDAEQTFFHGIEKLPAGWWLRLSAAGCQRRCWWQIDPSRSEPLTTETTERVRALMSDAVRLRLADSAPPAFSLSGGLDSSSAMFLALPFLADPPAAISLCFDEVLLDERPYIAEAVRASQCRMKALFLTPEAMVRELPVMFDRHAEPLPSAAWYSHYRVTREAAAQGFRTMVFGHGLDELTAGYPDHYSFHLADLRLAGHMAEYARELEHWKRLYCGTSAFYDDFFHSSVTADGRWNPAASLPRVTDALQFVSPRLAQFVRPLPDFPQPFPSLLKNALLRDLLRHSIPMFMRIEDANCAICSVESLAPFLDHRLLELLMALPASGLIRGGQFKLIIREAMRGVLPELLRLRLRKVGLNIPFHTWMDGLLGALLRETLNSTLLQRLDVVDIPKLQTLNNGKELQHVTLLWRVTALTKWFERWMR